MEIGQSYDRLISTMGFPILVIWLFYTESGPCRHVCFVFFIYLCNSACSETSTQGDHSFRPISQIIYELRVESRESLYCPNFDFLIQSGHNNSSAVVACGMQNSDIRTDCTIIFQATATHIYCNIWIMNSQQTVCEKGLGLFSVYCLWYLMITGFNIAKTMTGK